jgi:hypothetical protein
MHRVERLSIREISKRSGLHRKTIRRALAAEVPPKYVRASAGSKLDLFKEWICEQLRADPGIQSLRLREMAAELGYRIEWDDGRTSVYTPAAGAARDRQAGGVTPRRGCRSQRLSPRVRSRRPAVRSSRASGARSAQALGISGERSEARSRRGGRESRSACQPGMRTDRQV